MNIEELKKWIGSSEKSEDIVTSSLEQRFRATLDIDPGDPKTGDVASSGIHWTLAPPVYKHSDLGKDSHPKKGGFLPPVTFPRRMWQVVKLISILNFILEIRLQKYLQ